MIIDGIFLDKTISARLMQDLREKCAKQGIDFDLIDPSLVKFSFNMTQDGYVLTASVKTDQFEV